MTSRVRAIGLLFLTSTFLAGAVLAAPAGQGGQEKDEPKTIAELTAESERIDGLFTLFRDRKTGVARMLIRAGQLGQEFIYLAQVANGLPQVGFLVRGTYLVDDVITVRRHFDRIEFVAENTSFYFDPQSPLSRAADANQMSALLAVEKIVAEDKKTGDLLIEADKLFLTESLYQVKPSPDPDADPKTTYSLGSLSEQKSRILALRSYPRNTDVEVEYVFEDPAPRYDLLENAYEIKDPRNVSIRLMHSFIAMPTEPYAPRRDDPRVGYYAERITDLTADSATPYRDVIDRWKLEKKDPAAALSEPVEPIVWWIENTTPLEWRDLIREATLAWNASFEKAGFRNAIVVRVQPDDADWEAGDIRYNVLRWTSSPSPLFGGYGPSFTNPRTGQILGADIMLEYSYITDFVDWARSVPVGTSRVDDRLCAAGSAIKQNLMLGRAMAKALNLGSELEEQMLRDAMFDLVMHEVGHTFALQHNFRATHLHSPAQLRDPAYVAEHGLSGSVMDYSAINFGPPGRSQTRFFDNRPGPYDDWAIEYGYSPGLEDPAAEEARLEAILARAAEPGLAFGNDADDMRSPGVGIDPRTNIFDLSNDPVGFSVERVGLLRASLATMEQRLARPGRSRQELLNAFRLVMADWQNIATVVSRQVGGVYVDRDWSQAGAGKASYTPVAAPYQRAAMQALADHVFAPDALAIPPSLYSSLQPYPRQFDLYGKTEDPKLHAWVAAAQNAALDHLLHPVVLKRISDTRLYGNAYELPAVFTDLTNAIFDADLAGDVNTFRQNLQMEYLGRLAAMLRGDASSQFDTPSKSMALFELQRLQKALGRKRGGNPETLAHTRHLLFAIERALAVEG